MNVFHTLLQNCIYTIISNSKNIYRVIRITKSNEVTDKIEKLEVWFKKIRSLLGDIIYREAKWEIGPHVSIFTWSKPNDHEGCTFVYLSARSYRNWLFSNSLWCITGASAAIALQSNHIILTPFHPQDATLRSERKPCR